MSASILVWNFYRSVCLFWHLCKNICQRTFPLLMMARDGFVCNRSGESEQKIHFLVDDYSRLARIITTATVLIALITDYVRCERRYVNFFWLNSSSSSSFVGCVMSVAGLDRFDVLFGNFLLGSNKGRWVFSDF